MGKFSEFLLIKFEKEFTFVIFLLVGLTQHLNYLTRKTESTLKNFKPKKFFDQKDYLTF